MDSGRYATVVTVQNNTSGLGCAMGKWNCYAVTVTQGVSNPNDRLGVNGTVATVAVARRAFPIPLKSILGVAAGSFVGANLERRQSEGRAKAEKLKIES